MAYSTGSATGCANFLQTLATIASGVGWTIDHNAAVTSDGWWLAMHNGTGCYVNLHALQADNEIDTWPATGYNSSNSYNNQTGAPPGILGRNKIQHYTGAGSFAAYHVFYATGTSPYIYAIIEVSSGIFVHMHFGTIVSAVGGGNVQVFTGSSIQNPQGSTYYSYRQYQTTPWSTGTQGQQMTNFVYATVDSVSKWLYDEGAYNTLGGTVGTRVLGPVPINNNSCHCMNWAAFLRQPNTFNALPVLLPIPLFLERAAGGVWAYVGDAQDIRLISIANNNPKDEITLGSDTWKIIPAGTKGTITETNNAAYCTGMLAYAFRKNA